MQNHFFRHQGNVLCFEKTGSGKKILLTFHGFGQDKSIFQPICQVLSEKYTIYSFDLFFHGESKRADKNQLLSKFAWASLLQDFLLQEQISRFSLLGFSMGGKFVFATLEAMPQQVEELFFIAPDGVKTSFWYSLATYPGWTQQFFKHLVFHPKRFQQLSTRLQKIRLVDKGIVRFAQSQLKTRRQRLQVYYSWLIFRELQFDMIKMASLINKKKIPITMFIGKYDRIITTGNMQTLLKLVPHHQLYVLE
ncbi:MAG: alpha/beta hydrolase, partial [Verrucomicrobia bacterium]|nr:alpha/beta hydrolase [Cytophagales bacterium]